MLLLREDELLVKERSILQDVIAFFHELYPVETRIIQQGLNDSRPPLHHDIFVHVEFPFSDHSRSRHGDEYGSELETYLQEMSAVISSAQNPIFITYSGSSKDCSELVHREDRLMYSRSSGFETTGYVAASDLPRLIELLDGIHPGDTFRIHGAALGACPVEFSRQLFGLVCGGIFLSYISKFHSHTRNNEFVAFTYLRDLSVAYKLFERSNIRLGVVHDTQRKFDDLCNPSFFKPASLQMVDRNTVVLPYGGSTAYDRVASTSFIEYG